MSLLVSNFAAHETLAILRPSHYRPIYCLINLIIYLSMSDILYNYFQATIVNHLENPEYLVIQLIHDSNNR